MQYVARFFFSLMLLASSVVQAQQQGIESLDYGPIHEAYVTKVTGADVLQAVAGVPPQDINEDIPGSALPGVEWIPGYWAWSDERNDFIWISGVWRRPPPGHSWVNGLWTETEYGWAWIRGYWSELSEDDTEYLSVIPPDPVEEDVGQPRSNDFFWAPGYWNWNAPAQDYEWIGGAWTLLDPHWVLVPAHYVWRPDGWVFIAAFWDWPLEERGRLYGNVWIEPEVRYEITYVPWVVVDPFACAYRLYPYYPDYNCFFHHHYFYNQDWWNGCDCLAPWWGWDSWWSFSWQNQWALWWWYCNPGYPQPFWLTADIAQHLYAPLPGLLGHLGHVHTPFFITPNGVVSPNLFVKKLGGRPVVPHQGDLRRQIGQDLAGKIKPPKDILKPGGKRGDRQVIPRPNLHDRLAGGARTIHLPNKDKLPRNLGEQIRRTGPKILLPKGRGVDIDVDVDRGRGPRWDQDRGRDWQDNGRGRGQGDGRGRGQGNGRGPDHGDGRGTDHGRGWLDPNLWDQWLDQDRDRGRGQGDGRGTDRGQGKGQGQGQGTNRGRGQGQGQGTDRGQGKGQGQGQIHIQGQDKPQIRIQRQDQGQGQGQIRIQRQDQGQGQGQIHIQKQDQGQIRIQRQDQGQGQMQIRQQGQGQIRQQGQGQGQIHIQKQDQGQIRIQRQDQGQGQGQIHIQRQDQGQMQIRQQDQGQGQVQIRQQDQGQGQMQIHQQGQGQGQGQQNGRGQGQNRGEKKGH